MTETPPPNAPVSCETGSDLSNQAEQAKISINSQPEKKKHHYLRNTIIIVAIVLVVAIAVLLFFLFRGVIAPGEAAAKYNTLSYIYEDDVTEYVETYRAQMGYEDSDEGWAEFLEENDLTPEIMRYATIKQLIIDNEINRKASQLGCTVDDSEVDEYIDSMKKTLAFDSEDIWENTLEMYGTTEENVREIYAHSLLEDEVCHEEVPMPSVSDSEIFDYLAAYYPDGLKTKHVYYLTMEAEDSEDTSEDIATIQQVQKLISTEPDLTPEVFADYVSLYCTDEDVASRNGANGWSIDMGDYSESYQTAVENTKKGHVSDVFREEEDGKVWFSIVWIDDVVKLPAISEDEKDDMYVEEYLSPLPDSLKSYFSDCTAQIKWDSDKQDYLDSLFDDSAPVIYGVYGHPSYYVDMPDAEASLQDESGEDSTEESAEESSEASQDSGEDSTEDADENNTEDTSENSEQG